MKKTLSFIIEQLKKIEGLYVAENWGQLNIEQPPVNFPCALVDIVEVSYSQTGRGQLAEATACINIADILYNGIDNLSPEEIIENELKIFDLLSTVNTKLATESKVEISPLNRIKLERIYRDDAIREFVLSYKYSFTDISMCPKIINYPGTKPLVSMQ